MRVTTIDGGFRGRRTSPPLSVIRGGIGNLSTSVQNTEADGFNRRFTTFDSVHTALRSAIASGQLGPGVAVELESEFAALGAERDVHRARLASLASPAELMEWRSTADSIVARADALAHATADTIGFSTGVRPWQIGVALVGGALVFGGAAWWLSQGSKRTRRRR